MNKIRGDILDNNVVVLALKAGKPTFKVGLRQVVTCIRVETPIDCVRDLVNPALANVLKSWIIVEKRLVVNK